MRARRNQALAAAILLIAGCSNREHAAATGASADSLANGLPKALVGQLGEWNIAWRHANPRLAPELLVRAGTSPSHMAFYSADSRTIEEFRFKAILQTVSPDSAYSVDFDMYVDYFDQEGGEVDSSPLLADFKSDSIWQVAFCGTPCFFDGAHWVDNDRFALTGATLTGEQAEGPWCAFLDIYNLRSGQVSRWVLPAVSESQFTRYRAAYDSILTVRLAQARARS